MNSVDQNVSLVELGMDSTMAVEIKQTLEREFDIFLTAQDIRNLNFAKLVEIRDKDAEQEVQLQSDAQQNEISGMQLLIRIIGNEDITPEVCLQLESQRNPRKVEMFFLAGIGGCAHVFKSLASRIKPVASALQYATRHIGRKNASIPEIAESLLSVCIYSGR